MSNFEEIFVTYSYSSAPDILADIKAEPVKRINSEKELFLELESIKEEPVSVKSAGFRWYGVAAAVAMIIICVSVLLPIKMSRVNIAGNIIIDCNPSFNIEITNKTKVNSVYALNDDGAEIIENINKEQSLDNVMGQIVRELKNSGYLSENKNNLLISYCYKKDDKQSSEIKMIIDSLDNEGINVVYQSFKEEKELTDKAAERNVSVGKYKFVERVNQKNNESRTDLYEMNINEISEFVDEKFLVNYYEEVSETKTTSEKNEVNNSTKAESVKEIESVYKNSDKIIKVSIETENKNTKSSSGAIETSAKPENNSAKNTSEDRNNNSVKPELENNRNPEKSEYDLKETEKNTVRDESKATENKYNNSDKGNSSDNRNENTTKKPDNNGNGQDNNRQNINAGKNENATKNPASNGNGNNKNNENSAENRNENSLTNNGDSLSKGNSSKNENPGKSDTRKNQNNGKSDKNK